ncbi:MAG: cell wall hydrolase [Bacteroidota bacterium]
MLRRIRESKLVKPICGLMLTSMILSFSIGILSASDPSIANGKPATAKVLPKTSNSLKQTAPDLNHITVNNQIAQVGSGDNNQGKSGPNENPVNSNATTWKNGTTWKPVNNVKTAPTKVSQPKSSSKVDIYLLARVIYAESRGEPFEGQVAVGAVLMNRLKDSRFPKNLSQIIFKRGEFCTVRDGQIWKNPSQEAIKAARLAAAGWDPTGGALYFYNPAKTTSRWIWSRPVVNRIGNHTFAA